MWSSVGSIGWNALKVEVVVLFVSEFYWMCFECKNNDFCDWDKKQNNKWKWQNQNKWKYEDEYEKIFIID